MIYEPVIGLEVHAELLTRSKMFCACPVVDTTRVGPNQAVCPVCSGMPGVLPVINQHAVELALRVAAALECQIAHTSLFARKNYFYPDLPKGYQITQFEFPLAINGRLVIRTNKGEKVINVRRVHMEEDTGKLTHVQREQESYSLVDLNRAGVPLLEIVSEPEMFSVEEARAYAGELRALLRCLGASSGDMDKGALRFEANVSVRLQGNPQLGTRSEIKNLNSFRSMERAIHYEVQRQSAILDRDGVVAQETLGWDEAAGITFLQRSKEDAHDYRYFPDPDLPPLVVDAEWVERVRVALPELPRDRTRRLMRQYDLGEGDARLFAEDPVLVAYFEACASAAPDITPRTVANWITGELFAWLNNSGETLDQIKVTPQALAELLIILASSAINLTTAKAVLAHMLHSGQSASALIAAGGLQQISDTAQIAALVQRVLAENPAEVANYHSGKTTVFEWLFGQVMRMGRGQVNPKAARDELELRLLDR
jgi:aspartyl-tRNA(Asn)/glutamyl-tRNA(Gln) amidotransferase subunit B